MDDGQFPVWKGLFDWSMKFQDGTRPTQFKPEEFTPERRAWLEAALKEYMQDFAQRMKQIKEALDAAEKQELDAAAGKEEEAASQLLEEREALLEELMDIVCSVDFARDLHKIGGLPPLLGLLRCRHPSLRWRAAEVVATCVANNPPVQQWFLDGGVLPALMGLLQDTDATCRTKGLLALSALVRHCAPGMAAFRASGGVPHLVTLCADADSRVQRKAFSLLQYTISRDRTGAGSEACAAVPALCSVLGPASAVAATGAGTGTGAGAGAGADAGVEEGGVSSELRQAALGVLLELAKGATTWSAVQQAPGLSEALSRLRARHAALPQEDREAEQEEDEAAAQLQALLAQGPPAAGAGEGVESVEESDHVPIDTTESNLKEVPLKGSKQQGQQEQQGQQGQGQQGQEQNLSLGPGAGSMMVAPRIEPY